MILTAFSFLLGFVASANALVGDKVNIYSPYNATSSSYYTSSTAPYYFYTGWAIEGTSTRNEACFVSKRELNPWWTLDLNNLTEIKNVQVVTPLSLANIPVTELDQLVISVSNNSDASASKQQCGSTFSYPAVGNLPESIGFVCGSLSGRYIHATVNKTNEAYLILCEVIINVATATTTLASLGEKKIEAAQSSDVASRSADLAIDSDSSYNSTSCSSTTNTADPWLRIDLLEPDYVTEVKVKFFGDGGNGSTVAVGGTLLNYGNDNTECGGVVTYSTNSEGYYSFVCLTPQLGQYINIKRFGVGSVQLQVCDVQVVYKSVLNVYPVGKVSAQRQGNRWYDIWKATDGFIVPATQSYSCYWSGRGPPSAYWRLTLPSPTLISSISMRRYETGNSFNNDMNGVSVYVGNKTSGLGADNELCGTWVFDGSNPIVINCTSSMTIGTYVYVVSVSSKYRSLFLCEVELYTPSWSAWGEWSSCSCSGGQAKRTRSRACQPSNFLCGGKTTETEDDLDTCKTASTIKTGPQATSVTEFQPVSLTCTINPGCPLSNNITWLHGGSEITSNGTKTISFSGNTSTLSISSAIQADAGSYKCQATNGVGSAAVSTEANVVVSAAVVDVVPKSQATTIGKTVFYDCQVPGVPLSDLSWYDGSKKLSSSDPGITIMEASATLQLHINPSAEADFKNYSCHYSSVSASVSLQRDGNLTAWSNWGGCSVTCGGGTRTRNRTCTNPTPLNEGKDCSGQTSENGVCNSQLCGGVPVISKGPTASAVNVSGTLTVTCEAQGDPVPNDVKWFRDGKEVTSSDDARVTVSGSPSNGTFTSSLMILNVASSTENGKYICTAISSFGNKNSTGLDFKVQVAPKIDEVTPPSRTLLEGSAVNGQFIVSLSNDADVFPPPSYLWKFGGTAIDVSDTNDDYLFAGKAEIVIPSKKSLAGVYTCTVSNAAGKDTVSFTLTVNVPSKIQSNLVDQTVNQSDTFAANCTAHGVPSPSVQWYKVVKGVDQLLNGSLQTTGTHSNGDSYATLTIQATAGSDSGTFKCKAQNDVKLSAGAASDLRMDSSNTLDLTVNVPPVISSPTDEVQQMVVRGNSVRLDCLATGTPSPSFSWTFDNQTVSFQSGNYTDLMNGSILIQTVEEGHAGEYFCFAANLLSTVQSSAIQLTVLVPPQFIVPPFDVNITGNATQNNITIGCEVEGIPAPAIDWSFEGQLLATLTSKYIQEDFTELEHVKAPFSVQKRLTILSPNWDDGGTYTCQASSAGFTLVERSIKLTVQVSSVILSNPKNATIGESMDASFECSASGVPNPDIEWLKDGNPIDPSSSRYDVAVTDSPVLRRNQVANTTSKLTIKASNNTDSALYKCRANNVLSSQESTSAKLTVEVASQITSPPSSVTRNQSDSVTFSCTATGVPRPLITWNTTGAADLTASDATIMPATSGSDSQLYTTTSTLTVPNVQKSYEGNFRCIVQNGIGLSVSSPPATLTVQVRPTVTPVASSRTGVLDMDLTLEMKITNDFPLVTENDIVWTNQSSQMPLETDSSSTGSKPFYQTFNSSTRFAKLVIRKISEGSRGGYRCTATNAAGSGSAHITVVVEGPPLFVQSPEDVNFIEGQAATIMCEVTAAPDASFSWKKDGVALIRGQKLNWNPAGLEGSLVIGNVTFQDRGSYTCNSSNKHGSIESPAVLGVQVPPVIVRSPNDTLTIQPGTAMFTCDVTGEPQPTISWWKGNQQLNSGGLNGTVTVFPDNKTIVIANTTYFGDRGKYECRAENFLVEKKSVTAMGELTVYVYPEIIESPRNTTANESGLFELTCRATGFPVPSIFWDHVDVNNNVTDGLFPSTDLAKIEELSTLTVSNLKFSNRGVYQCTAMNKIGAAESEAEVIVQIPVEIQSLLGTTVVNIAEPLSVECTAEGFPEPTISWTKDGQTLPQRYAVRNTSAKTNEGIPIVTSNLTIAVTERGDTGEIKCLASNLGASQTQQISAVIREPPDPPTGVVEVSKTSKSATISWTAPAFEGNSNLISYIVERTVDGNTQSVGASTTSYTYGGLSPFTNYTFRVGAVNAIGTSQFSDPSPLILTNQDNPEGAPVVSVKATSPQSILVSWTPVDANLRNGIILSYTINYRVKIGESSFELPQIMTGIPSNAINFPLLPLGKFTEYQIQMSASTKVGAGPLSSPPSLIRTLADKPEGPPTDLTTAVVTNSSFTLRWKRPSQPNGVIIRSEVVYVEKSSTLSIAQWPNRNVSGDVTETVITGLAPFTDYMFRVRSFTVEYSDYSNSTSDKTAESAPTEPLSPEALPINESAVFVSWQRPTTPNGIIRNYQVNLKASKRYEVNGNATSVLLLKERTVGGDVTNVTVTDLEPFTNYKIEIRAETVALGPPSEKKDAKTFAAAPPPQSVSSPQSISSGVMRTNPNLASTSSSFAVRLFKGSNQFGPLSHYQVIVLRLESKPAAEAGKVTPDVSVLKSTPDERFPQNQLKTYDDAASDTSLPYITAEFAENLFPTDGYFIVGGENQPNDQTVYKNGPADANAFYTVFLRAFVDASFISAKTKRAASDPRQYNLFTSSNWSVPVSTAEGSSSSVGVIVGVVIGVLVAVVLLIVFIIWFRRRKEKDELRYITAGLDVIENPSGTSGGTLGADVPRTGTPSIRLKRMSTIQKVALYEPPLPIPVSEFADHCARMRANSNYQFKVEYESIGKQSPKYHAENSSSEFNKAKNRYANIHAFDASRVKLYQVESIQGSDYINANYVDGFDKRSAYIATQGPLEGTVSDFWRMVWENSCKTIVMITRLQEQGRPKCFQYWPKQGGCSVFDKLSVRSLDIVELSDHVVRTFSISHSEHDENRTVKQFHFIQWPDHGVPMFYAPLLAFHRRVRTYDVPDDGSGPVIVHCSAGVGRTGTFIAIDAQLQRIEIEGTIDVYGYTSTMRQRRNFMVQTEDQYVFVHGAVMEALMFGKTVVNSQNLRKYVKKLKEVDPESERTGIEKQFKKLEIRNETIGTALCKAANAEINRKKNRTATLLPYDQTRVFLSVTPGVEGSDYINASFVDSHQRRQAFIAAQGPLPETVNDFWRMLWERQSNSIVMLTQLTEKNQERCAQYWPVGVGKKSHFGHIVVTMEKENPVGDYVMKEFSVTHSKENETRTVRQFHFTAWPENGVPSNGGSIIDLLGQVQKSQQQSGDGPVTVHCSTGVGRTGTFITLSIALERMKAENVVDLFLTVKLLRTQRPGMVQTVDQYKFCYTTLIEYLDSFDLYSNFK